HLPRAAGTRELGRDQDRGGGFASAPLLSNERQNHGRAVERLAVNRQRLTVNGSSPLRSEAVERSFLPGPSSGPASLLAHPTCVCRRRPYQHTRFKKAISYQTEIRIGGRDQPDGVT